MTTTSTAIISAESIHKSFGHLEILKGISLEVHPAEIVAIVGASGAGKTTLLQILGVLDRPDSGRVLINNVDVHHLNTNLQADFRNRNIGFVFQFHQLLPEFSAEENVAIPAMIGGASRKAALAKARTLLSRLGLQERLTHRPAQLSGGEKQRVAVARALINDPQVIFADEPTGALDSTNKQELHRIFQELREQTGQTIVVVTHDPEISKIADRTILLSDGLITSERKQPLSENESSPHPEAL